MLLFAFKALANIPAGTPGASQLRLCLFCFFFGSEISLPASFFPLGTTRTDGQTSRDGKVIGHCVVKLNVRRFRSTLHCHAKTKEPRQCGGGHVGLPFSSLALTLSVITRPIIVPFNRLLRSIPMLPKLWQTKRW